MDDDREDRFSFNPRDVVWSQCVYCNHKHSGAGTCDAFPGRIPMVILTNDVDHRKCYPGDNGIQCDPYNPDDHYQNE